VAALTAKNFYKGTDDSITGHLPPFFYHKIHEEIFSNLSLRFVEEPPLLYRSRIHEHTILLRFLSIILRVLRLEVSVYNVYILNHICSRGLR
jgi:hypothetical protein